MANLLTHPPDAAFAAKGAIISENQPIWGITGPMGFFTQGAHVGIKRKRKDLCLLYSEKPAVAAAMFTTNTVKAAPVLWSQSIINRRQPIHGIVINSGNANACTGEAGIQHTEQMAYHTAHALGCKPEEVLVASTGVIGVPLPIDEILQGIEATALHLTTHRQAAENAAEAILTTDTFAKEITVTVALQEKVITISGMAKGSGMIHPNMATMLSFITTDAAIDPVLLQKALEESVADSYHMISVDGDTSTNDMVVALANGMAGNRMIDVESSDNGDYDLFCEGLRQVNTFLAQAIAKDGEGATKFLTAHVNGARHVTEARRFAKAVISSNLVKTAFHGEDANWGRILAAMGATGISFDDERLSLSISPGHGFQPGEFYQHSGEECFLETLDLFKDGIPLPLDEAQAKRVLSAKDIDVRIQLREGTATATAWGCDLSTEYVHINSHYRT